MEEKVNPNTPQEEEQGLDIVALLRQLWGGRKTVIIFTVIFIALGLVAALTMKRTYTVTTVMVPQMNNAKSGGTLVSLASLAGFDLGMSNGSSELSPLVYPQIVNSTPFRLEMMHTPLHYQKLAQPVSMFDYAYYYAKPTLMDKIKKYTIGLPGVIMSAIRGPEPETQYVLGEPDTTGLPQPLMVSTKESKLLPYMGKAISLTVDKKEGYLTMTVTGTEPLQTAELALKAQQLLQEDITRFRIEKSESDLEYLQARYDEVRKENNAAQDQLAILTDKAQNVPTTRARLDQERARVKYTVTSSIYTELAKQLEQAKMQVKRDTPVFTIVQPVTVPMKPSNSRAKTVIIWTFLGIVLGCGWVLIRGYWPKLKNKFKASEPEPAVEAKPEAEAEEETK